MTDALDLHALINQGETITESVISAFHDLNAIQLNWKPDAQSWSIAQCLDHLIVGNSAYFLTFQQIAESSYKPPFWARMSPFSGYFGKLMLDNFGAEVKKKYKAPPLFQPTQSEIQGTIVQDFIRHQQELLGLYGKMEQADPNTVLASPALGLLTYPLRDTLKFLMGHELRHLGQAKRVLEHPQFPKA